jgi:hypothetical protein
MRVSRAEWSRACLLARSGGTIRPTLAVLHGACLAVTRRYPFEAIEGLAQE